MTGSARPSVPPEDQALSQPMADPAFARAFDLWLLLLVQEGAEIDLSRKGLSPALRPHPRGAPGSRRRSPRSAPPGRHPKPA